MYSKTCFWKTSVFTTLSRSWCFIVLFYTSSHGFSQTTNISGIINTYHSVIGINATVAKLDNVSGLSYGNTVVIIQMKGATISTANNSSFGDTSSLNNAGNYELATICSVSNDSVYFFNQLLNNYDVSNKVQLVKFGEYYSATVTDTVKAQSWNNTTGKGGVLALKVEEDLTLNAPLFADSTGYKGGAFYLHSSSCNLFNPVGNGYAYDATSSSEQNGAYKGEGVADVPANLDGARGAPANGGGGGNNHNNGGGGGGNLTGGGNGGGNFSTGPSGCTGNYQGRGGKALNSWSGKKIFLGGGGGAGHANNTVQTYAGGNGGGIVIVLAKNIFGNGYKISANGQNGRSTSYDGASGGGAGGSIIMNITNTYLGSLTVEANGGNGGNEDDDNSSGRCYGAGGGGSGGVIYFNGAIPGITTSYSGGSAGVNIDALSCGTPVPAINGSTGLAIPNYAYRESTTPSSSCTVALPVKLIYFNAIIVSNKKIKLEWDIIDADEVNYFSVEKLNSANNWTILTNITAAAAVHHYDFFDLEPFTGENIYRLKIITKSNGIIYSLLKRVVIKTENPFTIYPNPAKDRIFIKGMMGPYTLIKITDITGKEIKKITTDTHLTSCEIALQPIKPGLYLLHVNNYIEKIIILDKF
jgi:hypothetical protein